MAEVGGAIALKLNNSIVIGKISTDFMSTADDIELSDAEDLKESTYRSGRAHRETSGEFNLEMNGTNGISDLYDAYEDGSLLPFIYGGVDLGDLVFEGGLYIRDIEGNDPDNERSTITVSMRITGNVNKTALAGGFPFTFPFNFS